METKDIVKRLREDLLLSEWDATDEEILKKTKGSLRRTSIELNLLFRDIMKAINRRQNAG